MKSYLINYADKAKGDLNKFSKSGDVGSIKKIKKLVEELKEHPRSGTGKPEQLKGYKDREIWSRRITEKHRLVYEIREEVVIVLILSAYGHYED
jgi:toxin YoeB